MPDLIRRPVVALDSRLRWNDNRWVFIYRINKDTKKARWVFERAFFVF